MASIEVSLKEFDTADLIEEFYDRLSWDNELAPYHLVKTPSLVDNEKIEFFLKHREKISLEALENLIK